MGVSAKELTLQALELSVIEREKLASDLLSSTHSKELTEVDQAWLAIAEARYVDLASGKDIGIPESEFFAKVKEKLGWK